jgi:hypothetical protein
MLHMIMLAAAADLILTLHLSAQIGTVQDTAKVQRSLPCEAIPVRFVLEEPECADKLLQAMNVTNVRIRSVGSGVGPPKQNTTPSLEGWADEGIG